MYKRFDYIFAYDNLGSFPLKKVNIQSINTTDVKSDQDASISDHMALKASIFFENKKSSELSNYQHNKRDAK